MNRKLLFLNQWSISFQYLYSAHWGPAFGSKSILERCTKSPGVYWLLKIGRHKFLWWPLNKSAKTRKKCMFFFLYFHFSTLFHSIYFLSQSQKKGMEKGNGNRQLGLSGRWGDSFLPIYINCIFIKSAL